MSESNEVVEAVRERVRMADRWAKDTGYPPADYFDTMMDLRRMLAAWDSRADDAGRLREALREIVGMSLRFDRGGVLLPKHAWETIVSLASLPASPSEEPCGCNPMCTECRNNLKRAPEGKPPSFPNANCPTFPHSHEIECPPSPGKEG